ncbi:hypothetical protein [Acinetobacter bereziniae]|uniref:hypothetical protein n=1 Tax=Acinetobacter bereziniae TaxID=106648 RepID=UPI003AF69455
MEISLCGLIPILSGRGCFDKKRTVSAPGFSPTPLNRPVVKELPSEALKQQPPININGL